jgi:plastocyanin
MRTGPLVGLVALVMCGPLACGGGGGGGSGSPTGPSTPSTPSTPSAPATPSTPASPSTVTVQNNAFAPADLTVAPGTTVTWNWDSCSTGYDPYTGSSETCVEHSITWDTPGGTASPTQSKGSYQRSFTTAGTYNYHCAIHGAAMSGKVVVQ